MNDMIGFSVPRIACVAAATIFCCAHSNEANAQWEYEFGTDLGVIYSDNIGLAEPGLEIDDTVLLVIPSIKITNESDRLEADIRYRPEGYFYADNSDANDVFHVVDAQVTGAIVQEALFLFVSAVNYQTIREPSDPFPTSNLPITDNRVDAKIFEIRPYWDQDLGFADVLLEAAYVDSEYEQPDEVDPLFNENNIQKRAYFTLDNHEKDQGFAWGLEYLFHRFEYTSSVPWDYQRAAVDLGFWVNGTTRLFGRYGLETDYENYLDTNLDDNFWELGFQYRPSNRMNLEVAAGKRSFGDSVRFSMDYQLKRGFTSLSYSEDPASRGQIGYDYRPIAAVDNLDGFLDRPGAADRFVRKRGEWTTNVELARSELDLRLFYEDRSQRTSDDGTPLEDETYSGVAFRWAWNLGASSIFRVIFDFAKREFTDEQGFSESELTSTGVEYEFRFTERFSTVAHIHHAQERGDAGDSRDYDENQIGLMLRARF